MSVTNLTTKTPYAGNGVATVFPFTFKIFTAQDIVVTETTAAGVTSTLVLNTDYTVTGLGLDAGGSITRIGATSPPPTGTTGLIRRVLPLTQTADIRNQSAFYAGVHEDVFDKLTMVDQQQEEEIGRSLQLPEAFSSGVSTQLPAPLAGATLVWDPTAKFLQNGTSGSTAFETLNPAMDGTATPGARGTVSRGDHVHPAPLASLIPFTQTGTGATASTVDAQLKSLWFTPEQFGAVGDGVTDDTTAIQNCITAAGVNGWVKFAAKRYAITGITFLSGQRWTGAGGAQLLTGQTTLVFTAASGTAVQSANTAANATNFTAENIAINLGTGGDVGWSLKATSYSKLDSCYVTGSKASAQGILLDSNGLQCYFNRVSGCKADMTNGVDVQIQGGANVNTFIGGKYGNAQTGIYLTGVSSDNTFIGVDLESNTVQAIYLDGPGNAFYGTHIESAPIGFNKTANASNTIESGSSIAATVTTPYSDLAFETYRMGNTSAGVSDAKIGPLAIHIPWFSTTTPVYFDANPFSGTATSSFSFWRNTTTSGTRQMTLYNGDGTSGFGAQYTASTGVWLANAFGTANQVIAATGDFRLKSTGTVKFRNNANSADLTLVSQNASDQGLFGDPSSTNIGQGTWSFGSNLGINVASTASRNFVWQTAGVNKWIWQVTGGESGSNAGADISFLARDDSGNAIDAPFSITRASGGKITFGATRPVVFGSYVSVPVGGAVSSAATITPTGPVFHVTGTAAIATINLPYTGFTGTITLIPDGIFTTGTGGNIALASTAVVSKAMTMTYDGTKWFPSY